MIIDITKAFNSYLSYGVFNYKIENNNIYVNDLLIEARGRPRINQRNLDIFKLRMTQKLSYEQLGKQYNITKQRAYSICKDVDRTIKFRYFCYLLGGKNL